MASQDARMKVATKLDHETVGQTPVALGSALGDAAVQSTAKDTAKPVTGSFWRRWLGVFAILPFVASASGCGLLAAPCRVASAGLKIVPVVGHPLAMPFDGCAALID